MSATQRTPVPVYPSLENLSTQLSLPQLLDFQLEHNPDFPLYVFANHESDPDRLTEISMLEYIRAAHRAGSAIVNGNGIRDTNTSADAGPRPGEIVAIVAVLDSIVYSALIAGMIKVGLVPFPISTFLPPDTIAQLIQGNNIHRIITTDATLHSFLASIRESLDPTYRAECVFEEAPSLSILYPKLGRETSQDDFSPLSNTFVPTDEGKDLALCMHSSGSTGVPKTIRFTHRAFKSFALFSDMIDQTRKSRMTSLSGKPIRLAGFGFLFFHASAVVILIGSALYGPLTMAVFPPAITQPGALPVTATPENTIDHLKRTKATAMLSLPHFISTFARDEKAIEVLRGLDYVVHQILIDHRRGFIPTNAGDQLVSRGVRLRIIWASTECGAPTLISTEDLDPEDWSAFAFSKRVKVRWIPYEGGLFRCQFLATDTFQPSVENIPPNDSGERGFEVNDLFEPHPTKEGFWRIVGRIDDVIIQANGQKTLPGPIEDAVLASELVKGAVIFGHQHIHIGVLVELFPGHEIDVSHQSQVEGIRDQIWPILEETNKTLPQYSQIRKQMILIASKDKPLPRATKGTVNKAASVKLYGSEIEEIYETANLD
ncbi:hypothetical protein D9758_010244 [Tetrapyrgos nigripes]|uniref:AMP-dependent synthetase/ligase domain-containing protein n=1 Tax=Tetrapyrgos nigripes TaxID=182062 RepID=A0A8H5CYM6_9AGAR|nr:hypothetical protein D9758_010244 [Tetrapyrgos nigripes]